MSLLSNIKFRIEGVLTTSGTSVKVSNDLELNGVISVDKASVVLHNSSKTSIERMECSFAGGVMTIIKRGLTQANTKIEDANLKKERRKGAYGYITLLASDQMDIDNSGEASNINTNQNFYGQVNSLYGYGNNWKNLNVTEKLGLPKFNNIGEVNAAIPNPTNELVIIAGDLYHYNDVTAQREVADTGTPTPNASETVAGKVEQATLAQQGAGTETGETGAPLFINPKNLKKVSAGAADENKIPILDSSGKLAKEFIPVVKTSSGASDENKIPALDSAGKLASGFVYANVVMGSFTKNSADASVVQTIAHGLGRIPKKVEFFYAPFGNYSNTLVFHGIYNGTSTVNIGGGTGNPVEVGIDTTNVMSLVYTTGSGNYAVCTFDATNITLTWTKSGNPSGSRYVGRQAE